MTCPYCGVAIDPPPKASRKCPTCRQPITFRKNQAGDGVLLRADQVERFDAGKRAYFERRRMIREVAVLGIDEAGFAATEAELTERFGAAAAPGDVFWAIANRVVLEAVRRGDWHAASMAYWQQARRLADEGKPYEVVGREASKAELRSYQAGHVTHVVINTGSCEVCSVDGKRRVKVATEIEAPRIPHERCPVGWCSCYYTAEVFR